MPGVSSAGVSLAILENGNRYEGSIGLTFQDKINLGAYVILLKNLPDGREGPSLLALISASFRSNPIQLGMGFKLEGVGGLIGLHRTASIAVLRAGLANGSLFQSLIPSESSAGRPVSATDDGPGLPGRLQPVRFRADGQNCLGGHQLW